MKTRARAPLSKLLLLSLMIPLLSGCWDRLEIEDRAVVLGVGIDTAKKEAEQKEEETSHLKGSWPAPEKGLVRITIQVAVPGRIPLGPGSTGSGDGGQNTVWVVDGVGHTVDDAFNNLQQRMSAPLFFGHLRIIVVSEAYAKKGLQNLNDFFRRNPEIRRMNWLVVSQGPAEDLMRAPPHLERVPTLHLLNTMDHSVKMGRLPNTFLGVYWSSSSAKGREGYLPYIKLKEQGTVELSGLAYFRKDVMVGATKPLEIPMFMGIVGIHTAGGQAFVRIPGSTDYVLFGARTRKSVIKTKIENGKPKVYVKILIEGNLLEKTSEEATLTTDTIKQIQKELEKSSLKAYHSLIAQTQEKGSDIFAFGEHIRSKHPGYWNREIQTNEKWQEHYKELSVEVRVQLFVRRVGMKAT